MKVFDYRMLRLLVGVIALGLPVAVTWLASPTLLTSISAGYHAPDARNVFVGALCVVAAFLIAYQGDSRTQAILSKIGAVAATGVALCPTSIGDNVSATGAWHNVAAVTLFGVLTYFAFAFGNKAKHKCNPEGNRRSYIYRICGVTMLVSMAAIGVSVLALPEHRVSELRVIFVGECAALAAFGVSWFVAGMVIPGLSEKNELPWNRRKLRSQ